MIKNALQLVVIFLIGCGFTPFYSQHFLSGKVLDDQHIAIPYAQIYVKNDPSLRTVADANGNYALSLFPGEYFLVFGAKGFNEREAYIAMADQPMVRDIQLFPASAKDLQVVDVAVRKTNPGREIMLKVVEKRETFSPWNYPHIVDVYIKATQKTERKEKGDKHKKKNKTNDNPSFQDNPDDPFSQESSDKRDELTDQMNLVEVQLSRYFNPPNKVKEVRHAFAKRGDDKNLYYTTTVKSNFNFFQNLLHLDDLHQSPVSSPISIPGILSYKYRLEEQYIENGRQISKIRIIPRSTSTSTLEGSIWILDSLWLVQKLELTMNRGNLLIYDRFTIRQYFDHPGDSLCRLIHQELDYGVKYKDQNVNFTTKADFSDYRFSSTYVKKFFGNELSVTEESAYHRDTSFWNKARKIALTAEEKAFILLKDSIRDHRSRTAYLDSSDAVFNKVTMLKVLWFGIDHRHRLKKVQWSIGSVATTLRPVYIAGPRISPNGYYFKKWDNENALDAYTEASLGILNTDVKGRTWWRYRYAPFHFGTASFYFAHDFDAIRSYDAITQIYKRENFIEATTGKVENDYELLNGLYLNTELEFTERRSLRNYRFVTLFDQSLPNNSPMDFKTYQALIATATITYTPAQKYMKEAKKKVLLGSRYPSFYATYERGIPKLFGSDINHEYGRVGMMQSFKIGTLGTSSYHLLSGKFLSAKNLYLADFKFQRRSDPIWFSNPLYSFQGLDSSLPSKEYFLEGHFVHHDNGAVINKIPFMKKTNIGLSAGIGALYVKEFEWQHYEAFIGLERNFKFSRRRLRLGIYAVASKGNKMDPRIDYKVSFALLDDRNMKWNF